MNPDSHTPTTEERIDTVLAALRDVKAAPGIEQRIHTALLRAADAPAPVKLRWASLRTPQLAGATAAVAGAALLLSLYAHRRLPGKPAHRQNAFASSASPEQISNGAPNALAAQLSPVITHTTFKAIGLAAPKRRQTNPTVVPIAASGESEQAATEQGFPAPPLPLTEQERLLVRLVHRDDPVQLAQLTPAARERELQRDREQVREFFKAPPMLAANFKLEPYPTPGGTQ